MIRLNVVIAFALLFLIKFEIILLKNKNGGGAGFLNFKSKYATDVLKVSSSRA